MAGDPSALLDLLAEPTLTDIPDRVRAATEALYQQLIDAEASAFIGAVPSERNLGRTTDLNRSRPRTLSATAGDDLPRHVGASTTLRHGGTAGRTVLREDAHPARPYQEPDDNEDGAPQELLARKRNNSGDNQDDRENPQQCYHVLHLVLVILGLPPYAPFTWIAPLSGGAHDTLRRPGVSPPSWARSQQPRESGQTV